MGSWATPREIPVNLLSDSAEGTPSIAKYGSDFTDGFETYRKCPGRHLAEASLFITCASILHAYHIQPSIDETGFPMKIQYEFSTDGMLS